MHRASYHWASRIVHRVPLPRGTLQAALAGRRRAADRWLYWAQNHRPVGPLVWVHAASIGEALTASPVVNRLRSAAPRLAVVHSHTSPSVTAWPPPFGRDYADYLPNDEPAPITAVLEAVRPDLVVFSRGDLWPEFIHQCRARSIPVTVIGAEVSPTSRRLSRVGRFLYARVLASVSWIGAASEPDADRWRRIGARPETVVVTGDPRHDAVLERIPELGTIGVLREWAAEHHVIIGASLERSDEEVFLSAVRTVGAAHIDVRFLLLPHSVSGSHVDRLRRQALAAGIDLEEWSHRERVPTKRYVLVTVGGILFDLYQLAAAAYVGGGFRRNTLHAIIEPAAYGLPVVFGPRHEAARDATAVLEAGGGLALPRRGAARVCAQSFERWITDPEHRRSTGLAARSTVREGAAAASVTRLVQIAGLPTLEPFHEPRSDQ